MPTGNVFNPSGYAMVTMIVGTGQMKIIAQVNSMNDERVLYGSGGFLGILFSVTKLTSLHLIEEAPIEDYGHFLY